MQHADLDAAVARFADAHSLAGLAVGLVRDGELIYTANVGYASIETRRPVSSRTSFRVGSISKTLTGIAIMQLVHAQLIALDDPVNQHLRGFRIDAPPGAPPVTIRHLLTHTSGIGELRRFTDLFQPFIGLAVKPGAVVPDLTQYYAPSLRAERPAGVHWAYANHGFATLGALIEDVTGEPFDAYMRSQILDPFEMSHSDFVNTERVEQLATGYVMRRGRLKPVTYRDLIVSPAGSLFSSVDDMSRYVAALCAKGKGVINADLLNEMMAPQFRVDPRFAPMGLAFFGSVAEGHRVVGHDGGISGFVSAMRVAPDDDAGALVFTNTARLDISLAIGGLADELLRSALGITDRDVRRAPEPIAEPPAAWRELGGVYGLRPGFYTNARLWAFLGGEVEVAVVDQHLLLHPFSGPVRKPTPLEPVDPTDPLLFRFAFRGGSIEVAFSKDKIHFGLPLNATLYKRSHSIRRRARATTLAVVALSALAAALGGVAGLRKALARR